MKLKKYFSGIILAAITMATAITTLNADETTPAPDNNAPAEETTAPANDNSNSEAAYEDEDYDDNDDEDEDEFDFELLQVKNVRQLRWYDLDEKVEVTWSKIPDAAGYEVVFLSKENELLYETKTTTNIATYNDVLNRKLYKVKVRAFYIEDKFTRDEETYYSKWSKPARLFKQPNITEVSITDRYNKKGTKVVGTQLNLKWEKSPFAYRYRVYVSTNPYQGYKCARLTKDNKVSIKKLINYNKGKVIPFDANKSYYIYVEGETKRIKGNIYTTGHNYIYTLDKRGNIKREYYEE